VSDGCENASVAFQSPQSRITLPNLQDDIELRLKALGSARADTTERASCPPVIDPGTGQGTKANPAPSTDNYDKRYYNF